MDIDVQRVTRIHISKGTMFQGSDMRETKTYTVRNDDSTPRTVLIEHPLRPGWMLADGAPKPEETTSGVYRFRLRAEPKETAKLAVREVKPLTTTYLLTNLTNDQIMVFLQQKSINPEAEAAFRKIVEQKNRVAELDAQIQRLDDEKQKIYDDQQRMRENLKALKGSAEERALTQRYTQQLNDQETRLQAIEREAQELQARRDKEQAMLDEMVQDLTLDATL
jgi:hypothetical protein